MRTRWLSFILLFSFAYTANAQVQCRKIHQPLPRMDRLWVDGHEISVQEALAKIDSQRALKRIIKKSIQRRMNEQSRWRRWLSPRQTLMFESAQKIFLDYLVFGDSKIFRRAHLRHKRYPWQLVSTYRIDKELQNQLEDKNFEQFFAAYTKKFGVRAGVVIANKISTRYTAYSTLLALAIAVYWYQQSDQYFDQQMSFDTNMSDEQLKVFNEILEKSFFQSADEIVQYLHTQKTNDPDWNQMIDSLSQELGPTDN
ncbi:MAG: hypothetical protein COT73_00190 [Bdellovibrio sp. CG10_big_fil_rev_8_21_14_0_10_47_8]|nr:MAG: hypothetical protein COT73_00190 [Bdellovibrio sp. CG10_big_fil_rev_8_21_14_0_10_47_8]